MVQLLEGQETLQKIKPDTAPNQNQESLQNITKERAREAKIIRFLGGEKDVLSKTVTKIESPQLRDKVFTKVRTGEVGVQDYSEILKKIPPDFDFVAKCQECFFADPKDTPEIHQDKIRRAGILKMAIDGRFTKKDTPSGSLIDLRESTLSSNPEISRLLISFVEKFKTPIDFGETATSIVERIRDGNKQHPEKVPQYDSEIQNMMRTIYGERYEFYTVIKKLNSEAAGM
jgi:hypothetical protein